MAGTSRTRTLASPAGRATSLSLGLSLRPAKELGRIPIEG